jgi:hypothetical protein
MNNDSLFALTNSKNNFIFLIKVYIKKVMQKETQEQYPWVGLRILFLEEVSFLLFT